MLRIEIKLCIYTWSGKTPDLVRYIISFLIILSHQSSKYGSCKCHNKMNLDQIALVSSIQLHIFIQSQRGDLVKIHLVAQMPTTDVAQWTYAVSNLGFIYIYGLGHNNPWVESHMWSQQTWDQRSSRGQWPLVQGFKKRVTVSTYSYFHG